MARARVAASMPFPVSVTPSTTPALAAQTSLALAFPLRLAGTVRLPPFRRRHAGVIRRLGRLVQLRLQSRNRAINDAACSHRATIKASFCS